MMENYLSIIYRHWRIMQERAIKEYQLSGAQMMYIKDVCENPGISQEWISQNRRIDKGSVARSIKKLVDMGYIDKTSDPKDGRACKLLPTEKAVEFYRQSEACEVKLKALMLEGLSADEIEELKLLLGKVAKNVDKLCLCSNREEEKC